MADNTVLPGTGESVRTIEKSSKKTQVVAIDLGGAGAESLLTTSLPVTGPLTDTQLRATAVPVSGSVTATGPVTDTELRASAVPVSLDTVPSHAVTNAGTFATQATLQAGTAEIGKLGAGTAAIGKLAANSGVDIGDVDILSIAAGDNNIGNVDIASALPAGTNAIGKLAANSGVDIGDVDVLSMPGTGVEDAAETAGGVLHMMGTVRRDTPAASAGTSGDNATLNTNALGAAWVDAGLIAHDAADAGNPVKTGAKAITNLAGATMVAAADRTDLYADLDGVQITKLYAPFGNLLSERVTNTDGAATALTTFGATADVKNYITSVTICNSSAGFCTVDLRDGAAGAVIWTFPCPATGGVTHNFNPPLKQPTANTALAFDASGAVSTLTLSFNGFKSKA